MWKTIIILLIVVCLLFLVVWVTKWAKHYPKNIRLEYNPGFFGVTFSKKFATELGLDWKLSYQAILDDLKVKYIRLPIYWDDIERKDGAFNFSDYDYLLDEGNKRGVKFIVVLGQRQPRWPECHTPAWIESYNLEEELLVMLDATVRHYRTRPEISTWQIENEPFLDSFGVCPKSDPSLLQEELKLVRTLDKRPILLTASGELSSWNKEIALADVFGTTLYRVVWNKYTGYMKYIWPSSFYKAKLKDKIDRDKAYIVELQAEPWSPTGNLLDLSQKQADKSMSLEQFKANLQYAINTEFKQAYLWGVEWWYWQYKNGDPAFWQLARTMFE